jgi:hypothetical protein
MDTLAVAQDLLMAVAVAVAKLLAAPPLAVLVQTA